MSPARCRKVHGAPWVALVVAIIRGAPRLDGALCHGRPEVFDATDAEHIQTAAELCARCPALAECRAWAEAVPRSSRPTGVLAGRWRGAR